MRRRELIAGLAATSLIAPATAQNMRSARIGYLSGGTRDFDGYIETLREALSDLGWRTGDQLTLHQRHANGDASLIPALADELVALRPDLIACTGSREARSLQASTRAIPIV